MECTDVCWLVLDQLPQLESSEEWEPQLRKDLLKAELYTSL